MPHWQERLGEAEIHLLAIFVAGLKSGAPAAEASR
jgi:hypothetical protein